MDRSTGKADRLEADLIRRARAGDEAAYERLVREHQEAVFRLAYLFLGSAADAEDVAQEVFIRRSGRWTALTTRGLCAPGCSRSPPTARATAAAPSGAMSPRCAA